MARELEKVQPDRLEQLERLERLEWPERPDLSQEGEGEELKQHPL